MASGCDSEHLRDMCFALYHTQQHERDIQTGMRNEDLPIGVLCKVVPISELCLYLSSCNGPTLGVIKTEQRHHKGWSRLIRANPHSYKTRCMKM